MFKIRLYEFRFRVEGLRVLLKAPSSGFYSEVYFKSFIYCVSESRLTRLYRMLQGCHKATRLYRVVRQLYTGYFGFIRVLNRVL